MSEIVAPLLDWVGGLPLWALVLAVAVAVACESSLLVGLVVPGDMIVLLGAAGATSAPRFVVLVAGVTAGSLAGESLGYLIGRRWGGSIRSSRLGRTLGEDRWERAARFADRHGARAVLGARYVAALHAVLPIMAGTLRMPPGRFLRWSGAGALSWAMLYVGIGSAAGASARTAGEWLDQGMFALMAVLAAGALVLWLRAGRARREAGHAAQSGGEAPRAGAALAGRRQETGEGQPGTERAA